MGECYLSLTASYIASFITSSRAVSFFDKECGITEQATAYVKGTVVYEILLAEESEDNVPWQLHNTLRLQPPSVAMLSSKVISLVTHEST